MFTGIVQCMGRLIASNAIDTGVRITIEQQGDWQAASHGDYRPAPGDSICVNGACLTVTNREDKSLTFDVIPETLDKTTLGELRPGDAVNLEPAVTTAQPLGGHFMQGHIDGVGQVAAVIENDAGWRMTITPPPELMPYVIPKGSIAIEGVSLTLAAVCADGFEVALIPTTLDVTTLGRLEAGNKVNLEADILAKTVVHTLGQQRGGSSDSAITMLTLRDAGFVD